MIPSNFPGCRHEESVGVADGEHQGAAALLPPLSEYKAPHSVHNRIRLACEEVVAGLSTDAEVVAALSTDAEIVAALSTDATGG